MPEPEANLAANPPDRRARWVIWGLAGASVVLIAPLLPAVILALWLAAAANLVHRPLTRALGGRDRVAAAVTIATLAALVVPFTMMLASLAADAYAFLAELLETPRGKELLAKLVAPNGSTATGLWEIMVSQQARAWDLVVGIAGTAAQAVIAIVVILAGTYSALVDGKRWYAWFESYAPIPPAMLRSLRAAFYETGHGLFVGIGFAGVVQAVIATILYLVLGVPRPLELGLLTFCFSVVPAIGTAFVWGPIAAGLALTGRTVEAIVLAIAGVAVIGTVDNLVRPLLARRGHLQLPTYLVLVSMFAGVQLLGAWGLFVGPLLVRLAKAALESRSRGDGGDEQAWLRS